MNNKAIVFKIDQARSLLDHFATGRIYLDDETEGLATISYTQRNSDMARSSRVRSRHPLQEALADYYGGYWEWSSEYSLEATY